MAPEQARSRDACSFYCRAKRRAARYKGPVPLACNPTTAPLQGPEHREQDAGGKVALLVVFHCSRHPAVSRHSPG